MIHCWFAPFEDKILKGHRHFYHSSCAFET